MCFGIDFPLENLLGTLDGQVGHVAAQRIAGALDFLLGIDLGLRNDAGLFGFGFTASFVEPSSLLRDSSPSAALISTPSSPEYEPSLTSRSVPFAESFAASTSAAIAFAMLGSPPRSRS